MYSTAKECREQRGTLVKQLQDLVINAKKEERSLNAEEKEKFDNLDNEAERLKSEAEGYERIEKFDGMSLSESRQQIKQQAILPAQITRKEYNLALKGWFASHTSSRNEENERWATKLGMDCSSPYLTFNLRETPPRNLYEVRAQSSGAAGTGGSPPGSTTAGGYLVATDNSLMNQMEMALLAYGGMREVARVIRSATGANLPIPTNDSTAIKGNILDENVAAVEGAFTVGQVVLQAFKYTSNIVLCSEELIQDSAIDLASWVGQSLGVRIGRVLNDHLTTGNGTTQPQGVITGATSGGSTSSVTAPVYLDLTKLEHSVDPEYRKSPSCAFMFNDATLKLLKQIVDGNSRPLWQSGLTSSFSDRAPASILGYPYVVNQSMASWGANAKPILFGDFNQFLLRDVQEVTIKKLVERYAEYDQIAWLAFSRHDSSVIDAGTHPLKYLSCPAS